MHSKIASLLLIGVFYSSVGLAANVLKIKDSKVMIDNGDADVEAGQEFYALNSKGKRTGAIVKVTSVDGSKSIAVMTRGRVLPNQQLEIKPLKTETNDDEELKFDETDTSDQLSLEAENSSSASTSEDGDLDQEFDSIESADTPTSEEDETSAPVQRSKVFRINSKKLSLLFNLFSNSMVAKESDGEPPVPRVEDVLMKGTSIGVTVAWDQPVSRIFDFRLTTGIEPFSAGGGATFNVCDNARSASCAVNITYLQGGGYLRWNFFKKKKYLAWLIGGATARFPIGKSTTALRDSDVGLTTSYGFGGGFDFFISNKYFITTSAEQQIFSGSPTVQAQFLNLRGGFGFAY